MINNIIEPFIWQFNFKLEDKPFWLDWSLKEADVTSAIKYEKRFFWANDQSIILKGLSHCQLWLSAYKFETHDDCYLLQRDNRNIKFRKKRLHFKPLVSIENNIMAYQPKHKYHLLKQLSEIEKFLGTNALSGLESKSQVRNKLREIYKTCDVYKETLALDLMLNHYFSVEFSKIIIKDQTFHSLVIESPIFKRVQEVVLALGLIQQPQDYIKFLKGI